MSALKAASLPFGCIDWCEHRAFTVRYGHFSLAGCLHAMRWASYSTHSLFNSRL